jgi:hypothetical protein
MTSDLPYALGCPVCGYHVVVSVEDPDASMSVMYTHLFAHVRVSHQANQLLAKVRDLTVEEATR